jgi:hypothetical protein
MILLLPLRRTDRYYGMIRTNLTWNEYRWNGRLPGAEYATVVKEWLATANNPKTVKLFTEWRISRG